MNRKELIEMRLYTKLLPKIGLHFVFHKANSFDSGIHYGCLYALKESGDIKAYKEYKKKVEKLDNGYYSLDSDYKITIFLFMIKMRYRRIKS